MDEQVSEDPSSSDYIPKELFPEDETQGLSVAKDLPEETSSDDFADHDFTEHDFSEVL
jgi:hypothetical protein